MINKKKHVAFLMGGLSTEREVSINSGNACYDAIDKKNMMLVKSLLIKTFIIKFYL